VDNIKNNIASAWSQVHGCLEKKLPDHAIHAWFEPIFPVGFKNNIFHLEVPNQFFLEWIESHYKEDIIKAIKEVYGEQFEYKLLVTKEKTQKNEDRNSGASPVETKPKRFNNLNLKYTFENFIVGSNNEFAKTASESVSNNPGEQNFNPLIIYGGVGLGKTHLMHAIGNQALKKNNNLNIVNITSEQFTLDFVNSLRKNKTIEFAQNYRSADILLIDDIQFFRGKEQTQEQFFHTFNVLHQNGKQIVLTADKFPGEMKGLQSRLLSRFQSGLSVDVQPPNFEVRVAILLEKAEQNGLTLDYSTIEFIARHIKTNVRELEGTIIRLLAKSSLLNIEINNQLVTEVVKERVGGKIGNEVSIENIVKKVSEISQVKENDIVGKSRKMEIAEARQVCMYLCRDIMGTSLNNIGMFFGGRDHTTVMHALKTVNEKKDNDVRVEKMITSIRKELGFSFL
tara:strand:+ start:326 stop:1684 length:1359 start_codon:yes stop_codon:yes gene_type:complete